MAWINRIAPTISLLLIAGVALTQTSCQRACESFEPNIVCSPPTLRISSMPSAFPPFSEQERSQEWAREIFIGDTFGKEFDLYRAITSYRRAQVLLPPDNLDRLLQIDYNLILCYYLGVKYQEVLNIFECSPLSQATPQFPAFNQLLVIAYDCYFKTNQEEKAACVLEAINKFSPETADDLTLYQAFSEGDVPEVRCLISHHRENNEMEKDFAFYEQFTKSPSKARTLNAILPGAGYAYVGQKRSAVTSFLINALFTAAAYQFFSRGYTAAGAITASLEMGWYFGGINGAGIEANEYNARIFEGVGRKMLTDHTCFPVLMFETSF